LSFAKQFVTSLNQLIDRRTDRIRRLVIPSKGPTKKFDKARRDQMRNSILESASRVLVRKRAWEEFQELVGPRSLRLIRGRGDSGRFNHIYGWASKRFESPIIYSFWRGKKCLYVGKGSSYRRLAGYKNNTLLSKSDCIEVWPVRSKRRLPAAECLAVHYFRPSENENKPARVKWGRKCPICRRHDELREELDSLHRLKA
jgi:ribosomal protein L33